VPQIGPGKFGYSVLQGDQETPEGGTRLVSEPTYLKSKREAARYLGISLSRLERLMSRGLAYIQLDEGKLVRFRPEDLAEYIEQRRIQRGGEPLTEVR
jgi:excisionase family DNA binding protein